MGLQEYIAAQFRQPSGFGGHFVSFIMNQQNRELYEETAAALSLADSDRVLDIGCGNGYLLNLLAHRHRSDFVGIDISDDIIRAASSRNRRFIADGRMTISKGDLAAMDFASNAFDKVYSVNTVYFWSDLDTGFSQIRRVLKTSGLFINVFYSRETLDRFAHTKYNYRKYDLDTLSAAGRQSGFDVEIVPLLQNRAHMLTCR